MAASEAETQLILHNRILEELGAKHREFETLAELLEEIVFRCDHHAQLTLLNSAWERKTGWEIPTSIGRSLLEFISDQTIVEQLTSDFSNQEAVSMEAPVRARDGEIKTFNLKARRKGNTWYGSLHDISDLKATLSALEESQTEERKLSLVASSTDNLVIITDAIGRIEWVNRAFIDVTGFTLEEVQGRSPGTFLQGPETKPETIQFMSDRIRQGVPFNIETRNYNRDGQPYWIAIDCSPIFGEKGEISNFIAIERIITEQKESEEALRESERHYRGILDSVSEAIFYCSADFKLQYANPAWTTITGHQLGDGLDAYLSEFIHPEDLHKLFDYSSEPANRHQVFKQELRLRDKFKNWRRVELQLSSNKISAHGAIQLTGAIVDIEERWQETQAIIEAMKEAEALSQARTRFIANMSHEIRTPLNAIIGMSSVLQQSTLDADQRVCVDTLANGGKALLALVNDVLDPSKLDSPEIELEQSEFDLTTICEEAVDIVSAGIEEKNLLFTMFCAEAVPIKLIGDAHRLRQLLLNLLSNAIKFTSEGEISLQLSWRDTGQQANTLAIQVSDSGIGIPKDRLSSLFDAFVQADPSTTRQYGGTGLGLAICRQICSAMGGEIYAESAMGEGSTFTCLLPLKPAESSPPDHDFTLKAINLDTRHKKALESLVHCMGVHCHFDNVNDALPAIALKHQGRESYQLTLDLNQTIVTPSRLWSKLQAADTQSSPLPTDASTASRKSLRMLIAEDAIPNQLVISAMLKQLGYTEVTIVENGKLAVEHCRDYDYDVVLLDIHMPVMDGVTAANAIAPTRRDGKPILVAASADVTNESRQTVAASGFQEWLDKPFTRDALAALLSRLETEIYSDTQ